MTTETLDELYEKPSIYDISKDNEEQQSRLRKIIGYIIVFILLFIIFVLPQMVNLIIPLDGVVVEDNFFLKTSCTMNIFCSIESGSDTLVCSCPSFVPEVE